MTEVKIEGRYYQANIVKQYLLPPLPSLSLPTLPPPKLNLNHPSPPATSQRMRGRSVEATQLPLATPIMDKRRRAPPPR